MDDPYEILNLNKDADDDEIRRAYKSAAKTCHPDVNGNGDDTEFKRVRNAYEILIDPIKRKKYDLLTEIIDDDNLIDEILNRLHQLLRMVMLNSIKYEKKIDLYEVTTILKNKVKKADEIISKAEKDLNSIEALTNKVKKRRNAKFDPLKEMTGEIKQEIINEIESQKIEIKIYKAIIRILNKSYKIEKTEKSKNNTDSWSTIITAFTK